MKIDRIEVFRVHVPMKAETNSSASVPADSLSSFTSGLDKHILKVHTDDGLVGLGETWKGTPDAAVRVAAAEHGNTTGNGERLLSSKDCA